MTGWLSLAVAPPPRGLGWTPRTFWRATLAEFWAALKPFQPPTAAERKAALAAAMARAEKQFAAHEEALRRGQHGAP